MGGRSCESSASEKRRRLVRVRGEARAGGFRLGVDIAEGRERVKSGQVALWRLIREGCEEDEGSC